ncbi:MAG TPA: diaminopimelate epimerase [Acidimicrobiia bacterium]|nr:diaminopimelate epimerase [Acidimicrobiia bacterium]
MRAFEFTKMQGLGNDFIVLEGPMTLAPEEVDALCDRRFGIGADGVLVVTRGDPINMDYWNADGSAAEMCGNGLRCVARYVYDRGWAPDRNFAIQTPIGMRGVRVQPEHVEAELGRATLDGSRSIDGADYQLVDIGNPHAVRFVDDPAQVDVSIVGSAVQSEFSDGANVEFVTVTDSGVTMRVWERGVGETMACGTGMAAAALVAGERHGLDTPIEVLVPGGQGSIDIRDGVAWIVGPAEYSFRGSVGER